jgi:hypothetical protein
MVQLVSRGNRSGVTVTDYRDLIKTLNKIDPALTRQMRKDFRIVGKPLARAVSQAIPGSAPTSGIHVHGSKNVSGFKPLTVPGRLTWGANKQNGNKSPKHTLVKLPRVKTSKRGKYTVSSIVRVDVDNAAVVMADMAGASGKYINKRPLTSEYNYSRSATGKRRHRVNNQGRGMIRALNKVHKPSRWIYPSAEQSLSSIRLQAIGVLGKAYKQINEELRTK